MKDEKEEITLKNENNKSKNKKCEAENKKLSEKNDELSKEEYQNNLKSEIKKLEDKKASLQQEVDKLSQDIIRIKGEPKSYSAGHYTAGTDITPGRYKITSNSKTGNFFVYSSGGDLEVNIIIGKSDYYDIGLDEYIYTFKSGDKVESTTPFSITPIE